jgi:hypothetical protein
MVSERECQLPTAARFWLAEEPRAERSSLFPMNTKIKIEAVSISYLRYNEKATNGGLLFFSSLRAKRSNPV